MHIEENYTLKSLHSFGFSVRTAYFTQVNSEAVLVKVYQEAKKRKWKILPIGEGTNILFVYNFHGIILKITLKGIRKIAEDDTYYYIEAAAGENWNHFVQYCLSKKYNGLENLSFIPGSVGAAPVQNIGAYGVSFSQFLVSVRAYDTQCEEYVQILEKNCGFGYRNSLFKQQKNRYIITSLQLRLKKTWKPVLHHKQLEKWKEQALDAQQIADIVRTLREKKLPNPQELGNAGSFFKNPYVTTADFSEMKQKYPELIGYIEDKHMIKLSAAQLIEYCRWKGYRRDQVGVYPKHALVLVHYGQGRAEELYQLMKDIQTSVKKKFGVWLAPEVELYTTQEK